MDVLVADKRCACHCLHGRGTKPFGALRPRSKGPSANSLRCKVAAKGVRVESSGDGSVIYHFCEATNGSAKQIEQRDDNGRSKPVIQQVDLNLNGACTQTVKQQHISNGQASTNGQASSNGKALTNGQASTSTVAVVIEQDLQQQVELQEPEVQKPVQKLPKWARKINWGRHTFRPKNGSKNRSTSQNGHVGNGHVHQRNDSLQRARQQDQQCQQPTPDLLSAQHPSNLDSELDFENADTQLLLRAYSSRAAAGRLDAALKVLEGVVAASRVDVLKRVRHKDFLRPAADHRAVSHAMRFVQLMPDHLTDARTYNMLVTVCIAAKDLPQALQAGMMMRNTGRRLDTYLYTNLITACAVDGDTDMAFRLYEDMQADNVDTDPRVYTSLISTCSNKILRSGPDSRREQLVLLERAFGLFHDMQERRVRGDAACWNALIAAAGRAGQLQRAFEALQDMQDHLQQPDERTYTSLIDACWRAGEQTLALRTYRNALSTGCTQSMMLYAAAIAACQRFSDLDSAMEMYGEMQKHGVQLDGQLYGSLMNVAGQAKRVDLAFDLQADMVAHGQPPTQATFSALIMVCVGNQQIDRASEVYRLTVQAGLCPDVHAYNALINAYGCGSQFGMLVSVVEGMVKSGTKLDHFTFAGILNACQRANKAEVAFEVLRVMQQRRVPLDGTLCFILLRLCYNRLREEWYPGGYPPTAGANKQHMPGETSPADSRLLQVLSGKTEYLELPENVNWVSQAMQVYRQALSSGLRPSMKTLDRLLACLRLPYIPAIASGGLASSLPFKGNQLAELGQQGNDIAFDPAAITILEEAVSLGVVPPFRLDGPCIVDMRQMPPSVAEVYVLAMMTVLKRASQMVTGHAPHAITFLVQPFDRAQVYFPSYAQEAFSPQNRGQGQQSIPSNDDEEQAVLHQPLSAALPAANLFSFISAPAHTNEQPSASSDKTALGVVGMLRRLRLWTEEDPKLGKLTLLPKNIAGWLRSTNKAAGNVRSQSPMLQQHWIGQSIASQRQQLRSGAASRTVMRKKSQQAQSRQQKRRKPILWNDMQANARKHERFHFDE